MTERQWVRVTACDAVPLREGRAVRLGGRELAIFNLGDRFLATDNRCPHKGGPLCDGIVTGTSVVCPLHTWKINLETGMVARPASAADHCVGTYPTRVESGVVIVGLPVADALSNVEGQDPADEQQDPARGGPDAEQEPADSDRDPPFVRTAVHASRPIAAGEVA